MLMPQTAWATTATATIFKPCNKPVPIGPSNAVAAIAKMTSRTADGSVKAARAASAPDWPTAQKTESKADLAGGRAGKKLAQRHQIGVAGLVDPFAADDQFVSE